MNILDSSPIHLGLDTDTAPNGASRKPDQTAGQSGFAEVFAGLQPEPPPTPAGTGVRHPLPSDPDAQISPVELQRVELSPAMQLIMPAALPPDLASLHAFARAQGLDERAIQYLLGDVQGSPAPAAPAAAAEAAGEPSANTPAVSVPMATAAFGMAWSGLSSLSAGLVGEPGAEAPPPTLSPPGLLPPGLVRAAQPGRLNVGAPEVIQGSRTAWAQPIEVISLDLQGAQVPVDAVGDAPFDAADFMPPAWALKSQEGAPSGMTLMSRAAVATPMLASELASDLAPLEPMTPDDAPMPKSGQGPEGAAPVGRPLPLQEAAAAAGRATTEAALPAGAGRAEMADQLAQRMGEAIAQRLISRLEQGNWQFRFVLNPKTMGEVQVMLHMHGGALDGSFVASQAGTRELLNDGLQRLRDTLNASGMNVASLDVGAGQSSRQGQQSMAAAVVQPPAGPRSSGSPIQDTPAAIRHRDSWGGEQGWDVLV